MKIDDIPANGDGEINAEKMAELVVEKKREWPQMGDEVWTLKANGELERRLWSGGSAMKFLLSLGLCRPTGAEMEQTKERLIVETELRKLAEDAGGVEWGSTTTKYCVSLEYSDTVRLGVDEWTCYRQQGTVYFPSEQSCRAAIASIGEDRIKRALFGVTP
jgi:hypothetical protein